MLSFANLLMPVTSVMPKWTTEATVKSVSRQIGECTIKSPISYLFPNFGNKELVKFSKCDNFTSETTQNGAPIA